MKHPRPLDVLAMLAIVVLGTRCSAVPALCAPEEGRVGFFSKGDCVLTNGSSFRGHEWITFLGNLDLPPLDRFSEGEINAVIEGNRRVDWPKELLVHLGNSILSYLAAANAYHDRPESQPIHFLLDATNDTPAAVVAGNTVLRDRTRTAVAAWTTNRPVALAAMGGACHTLEDSFSKAHTDRDASNVARPWCIRRVKAYLERARGFEVPSDQIHGGNEGDTIGHTTSQDSIYRSGRDCVDPQRIEEVELCLADEARRARTATRDYLGLVHRLVRETASEPEVDQAIDGFFEVHTSLCP